MNKYTEKTHCPVDHHHALKNKLLFPLIALSISIVIALVLVEVYIRLFSPYGYVTPEILKKRSFEYVPGSIIWCYGGVAHSPVSSVERLRLTDRLTQKGIFPAGFEALLVSD